MAWMITIGVVLLLCLIAFSRIRFFVTYDEKVTVKAKWSIFSRTLVPKKDEVDPKEFTNRALRKKAKKEKKKEKKSQEPQKQKRRLSDYRDLVTDLASAFSALPKTLIRHARIRANRICVVVATEDAAKTAYLTGWVRNGLMVAETALYEHLNYQRKKKAKTEDFWVSPNFVDDQSSVEIDIRLQVRVWQALILVFKSYLSFLKFKQKRSTNHDREQTE